MADRLRIAVLESISQECTELARKHYFTLLESIADPSVLTELLGVAEQLPVRLYAIRRLASLNIPFALIYDILLRHLCESDPVLIIQSTAKVLSRNINHCSDLWVHLGLASCIHLHKLAILVLYEAESIPTPRMFLKPLFNALQMSQPSDIIGYMFKLLSRIIVRSPATDVVLLNIGSFLAYSLHSNPDDNLTECVLICIGAFASLGTDKLSPTETCELCRQIFDCWHSMTQAVFTRCSEDLQLAIVLEVLLKYFVGSSNNLSIFLRASDRHWVKGVLSRLQNLIYSDEVIVSQTAINSLIELSNCSQNQSVAFSKCQIFGIEPGPLSLLADSDNVIFTRLLVTSCCEKMVHVHSLVVSGLTESSDSEMSSLVNSMCNLIKVLGEKYPRILLEQAASFVKSEFLSHPGKETYNSVVAIRIVNLLIECKSIVDTLVQEEAVSHDLLDILFAVAQELPPAVSRTKDIEIRISKEQSIALRKFSFLYSVDSNALLFAIARLFGLFSEEKLDNAELETRLTLDTCLCRSVCQTLLRISGNQQHAYFIGNKHCRSIVEHVLKASELPQGRFFASELVQFIVEVLDQIESVETKALYFDQIRNWIVAEVVNIHAHETLDSFVQKYLGLTQESWAARLRLGVSIRRATQLLILTSKQYQRIAASIAYDCFGPAVCTLNVIKCVSNMDHRDIAQYMLSSKPGVTFPTEDIAQKSYVLSKWSKDTLDALQFFFGACFGCAYIVSGLVESGNMTSLISTIFGNLDSISLGNGSAKYESGASCLLINTLKPLILYCPFELYSSLLRPVLLSVISKLIVRVDTQWSRQNSSKSIPLRDEIGGRNDLILISKTYCKLLCCFLGSTPDSLPKLKSVAESEFDLIWSNPFSNFMLKDVNGLFSLANNMILCLLRWPVEVSQLVAVKCARVFLHLIASSKSHRVIFESVLSEALGVLSSATGVSDPLIAPILNLVLEAYLQGFQGWLDLLFMQHLGSVPESADGEVVKIFLRERIFGYSKKASPRFNNNKNKVIEIDFSGITNLFE